MANSLNRQKWARGIFLLGFIIMLAGLSTSRALMSISSFVLIGAWIIHGDYKTQWKRFTSSTPAVLLVSFYLLHLFGLLWTSDFSYAENDLRIKLPLLLLPIVVSGMPSLRRKEIKALLHIFCGACLVAVAMALHQYYTAFNKEVDDIRSIVYFNSNVRLALNLVLAATFMFFWIFRAPIARKFLYLIAIAIILWFLNLIESATGYFCIAGVFLFFFIRSLARTRNPKVRFAILGSGIFAAAIVFYIFFAAFNEYFTKPADDLSALPQFTENGNPYYHDTTNLQVENGHYVWIFLANEEMKNAWKSRTGIDLEEGTNKRMWGDLVRYLTSKGLRKDSVGVFSLSENDVSNIKKGIPTVRELKYSGIFLRLDRLFFEYNVYINQGNPSGNSATQRLEFWKVGWGIVKDNFFTGVGTGDVQQAYDQQYRKQENRLDEKFQLRAHNQFLTIWITFGIFGLLFFIFILFYPFSDPVVRENNYYLAFFIVVLLSFVAEDTLETQAGLSFFVAFYTFFLLADETREIKNP